MKKGLLPLRDTELGFWGTSGADEVFDIFQQIKLDKYKKFIDIGSGDGKVVLIASLFTDSTGIEVDDKLTKTAIKIRDELSLGTDTEFICEDFMNHDLSKYDVIFTNPDKEFKKGIGKKLSKEMKKGAILLVYNFIYKPHNLKKGKTYWHEQVPVTIYKKP